MKQSSDILIDLNPAQQEAVTFPAKPLLILAGAGSGKTRVLTRRAAWFIKNEGIDPSEILLITFTNKAAAEMRERINKLTGNAPTTTGTFHSLCARILRQDGKSIGISPSFTIYDEQDSFDVAKEIIEKIGYNDFLKPATALSAISSAKNELIDAHEFANIARGEFQDKISIFFLEYQRYLRLSDALDFDDLLLETVRLFRNNNEALKKYQNKFRFILVDEWQDTNRAQYEITKLLILRDKNLSIVGDAAQSIYSWRGADYRNIDYLIQDFPDIKIINLEQNYRSTQIILDAANSVISKNKKHPILKLWTDKKTGPKITIYEARSETDEANFVVNEINQLIQKSQNQLNYTDFAVLYRTNAQSRPLEESFLQAGIPYILVGGIRFYERREIKDVISYLRFIFNPDDLISRKRIEKLGKKRFEKFLNFTKRFKKGEYTTLEILDKTLDITGYLEMFDKKDKEDLIRLENIRELRSVASQFAALSDFLEQVSLLESAQDSKGVLSINGQKSSSAVTLATAHATKGLEFTNVFIIGMEEGLFPHSRSMNSSEELEEERRLCYVGMTRAKERLYLTYARRRLYFGLKSANLPSRFLADIPQNLTQNIF